MALLSTRLVVWCTSTRTARVLRTCCALVRCASRRTLRLLRTPPNLSRPPRAPPDFLKATAPAPPPPCFFPSFPLSLFPSFPLSLFPSFHFPPLRAADIAAAVQQIRECKFYELLKNAALPRGSASSFGAHLFLAHATTATTAKASTMAANGDDNAGDDNDHNDGSVVFCAPAARGGSLPAARGSAYRIIRATPDDDAPVHNVAPNPVDARLCCGQFYHR